MDMTHHLQSRPTHTPCVCTECQSPRVVAIPYPATPFDDDVHLPSKVSPTFDNTYGLGDGSLGTGSMLFQLRCVECATFWFAFFIYHVGSIDMQLQSPRNLYDFAAGHSETRPDTLSNVQSSHIDASTADSFPQSDSASVPIQPVPPKASINKSSVQSMPLVDALPNQLAFPANSSQFGNDESAIDWSSDLTSGLPLHHNDPIMNGGLGQMSIPEENPFQQSHDANMYSSMAEDHTPIPTPAPVSAPVSTAATNLRRGRSSNRHQRHEVPLGHSRGPHFDRDNYWEVRRRGGACPKHKRERKTCRCRSGHSFNAEGDN